MNYLIHLGLSPRPPDLVWPILFQYSTIGFVLGVCQDIVETVSDDFGSLFSLKPNSSAEMLKLDNLLRDLRDYGS